MLIRCAQKKCISFETDHNVCFEMYSVSDADLIEMIFLLCDHSI